MELSAPASKLLLKKMLICLKALIRWDKLKFYTPQRLYIDSLILSIYLQPDVPILSISNLI